MFILVAKLAVLGLIVLAGIIANLDTAVFSNIVAGIFALLSPVLLKKFPAHDGRMVLVCIAVSLLLALAGVGFSGGLSLDWHSAQQVGIAMAAFIGLQQTFYALFRDAWHLDTP